MRSLEIWPYVNITRLTALDMFEPRNTKGLGLLELLSEQGKCLLCHYLVHVDTVTQGAAQTLPSHHREHVLKLHLGIVYGDWSILVT